MVIYSLALLAGICCFQFFSQLPPLAWSCVAAIVAIVCWLRISLRPITVFLFGLFMGVVACITDFIQPVA